ncbi:MAG: hypothetical protein EHM42_08985 [Planctomycetaceae bacterium]|nr:MAG: hypothetical protein EHM42_08985 [Planctomycetaceae bacterium]
MPLQTDTPADLIAKYPPAPVPILNGKPNPAYVAWAQALAALHIAKSLQIIDARWLNTTRG